jgi:type I site-specific restriction endonuclease
MLMRCNWVKRALFLADRVALVEQTIKVEGATKKLERLLSPALIDNLFSKP